MVAMRDSSGSALAVGRLTGWEPLGFEAGDNNWYRFVANGPTAKTDPAGLQSTDHRPCSLDDGGPVTDALCSHDRGESGPPPIPVPGGEAQNGWKWNPNPQNPRGGTWGPRLPLPNQGQPSASWDPEGHWDVDDGNGSRQRYLPDGRPITPGEAHDAPMVDPGGVQTIAYVTCGVAGGYLIYRCGRMIPSLFPPLWWTIPVNAACP